MRPTFRCIPFKIIVIVKNLLVWKTHIDRGTKLLFCLFEALKCPFWNLVPFSFLYILIQFFFLLFVVLYNAPSLAHCYARLKFFSLNGCCLSNLSYVHATLMSFFTEQWFYTDRHMYFRNCLFCCTYRHA